MITWILGGAALIGGYFLLKGDKKKTKKSDRVKYELIFGRMSLAVKQCGPLDPAQVEDIFDMSFKTGYPALENMIRNHCPAVFEVPEQTARMEGQVTLQAMATMLGTVGAMGEFCPEVFEGPSADQVERNMQQFTRDLVTIGALGAVTAFRQNTIALCPAIESLTGEELLRRGNQTLIELGIPEV